ncbi:MAG: M23 family metallopeptidase, partial [Planktothrix sp.]
LKQGDFNFTLYKDGRQWGSTLKPQINQPLQFKDLPAGNYQVRVNVTNSSKNGGSYKTVFNLDQAGQTLAQARNLGKLTDQKGRLIVNDHVGIPTGDLDYYKFSTDSNRRLLQFAVRHPSGNGSLPLEGNVEFILYDKNGKLLKKVNSANKKAILDTYELAPNSEYYVRVKAHSGNFGNYQLVLNGDVKRNPVGETVDKFQPINSRAEYLKRLYGSNPSAQVTQNPKTHGGPIDTWAGLGANLYALAGGEVIEARNGINYGANSNNYSNWVNNGTIAIYNKELDMTFIYWHLQEGSIDNRLKGKTIAAGTLIGKEGKTGYVVGPSLGNPSAPTWGVHTHVEVHKGRVNINMAIEQAPANSGRLYIPSALGNGLWS